MKHSIGALALALALCGNAASAAPPLTRDERVAIQSAQDWVYGRGAGDRDRALSVLEPMAEAGQPRAHMLLGFMYRHGRGVARDLDRALAHYRAAEGAGTPRGALLGAEVALDLGRGAEAVALLRAADGATAGPSAHLWARGHMDGLIPGASPATGQRLLAGAIARDELPAARMAMARVGNGADLAVDMQRAVTIVTRAADAGDPQAAASLLQFLRKRPDLVRDAAAQVAALQDRPGVTLPAGEALLEALRGDLEIRPRREARAAVVARLEGAQARPYGQALTQLRWLDRRAWVQAVQSALTQRGLFEGRINGRQSLGTLRALKTYCRAHDLSGDCQRDPLAGPITRAISLQLARDHSPR